MTFKILLIASFTCVLTGVLPSPIQQISNAQVTVSFQTFYDQLSPFGSWVSYPNYGYVWLPNASAGFRPYGSRGHWVYTEDGWTWVSDYSWGWATFHYGNWFYDDSYGWMWIPGNDWAPAWVTWGEYDGNYCWAPIGPNINIGVSFDSYRPPYNYWNFCPRDRITSVNISHYYVNNIRTRTVVNNITVINNVNRGGRSAWLRGPAADNVSKYTHSPVRPVPVRSATRPGASSMQSGQLAIYRPAIQQNRQPSRPARVQSLQSVRPANSIRHAAGSPARDLGNNGQSTPQRPAESQRPAVQPTKPNSTIQRPTDHPHPTVQHNPGQLQREQSGNPAQESRPINESRPGQPPHPTQQSRPVQESRPSQQPHPTQQSHPVQQQPVQQQHSQPVRQQPPHQQPVHQQPVHQQPVHQQQPVQRPPVQQRQPVQQRPVQPRPAPQPQPHPVPARKVEPGQGR